MQACPAEGQFLCLLKCHTSAEIKYWMRKNILVCVCKVTGCKYSNTIEVSTYYCVPGCTRDFPPSVI